MSSNLSPTLQPRIKLEFIVSSPTDLQTEVPSQETATNDLAFKLTEMAPEEKTLTLTSLTHPRILTPQDSQACYSAGNEIKLKGSFLDLIENFKCLPTAVTKTYFLQLLDTIEYLHQTAGISHGDISLQNVLVDETYNLKLTGIASAKGGSTDDNESSQDEFCCPESWKGEPYSMFQADIFALGVILFEMVAGYKPFEAARDEDPIYELFKLNKQEEFWLFHEDLKTQMTGLVPEKGHFPANFRELVNLLLAYETKDRLKDITDIKKHAWCQGMVLNDQDLEALMKEIAKKMCL